MFDRHLYLSKHTSQSVTVNEQRAPTDESVRLLREMEQAAQDKVVQSIRLDDSPIDCVIHAHDDHLNQRREFCIFVRIKGRQIEVRRGFNLPVTTEVIAEGLLDAVSTKIAAELLKPAFDKLPTRFQGGSP